MFILDSELIILEATFGRYVTMFWCCVTICLSIRVNLVLCACVTVILVPESILILRVFMTLLIVSSLSSFIFPFSFQMQ